MWWDDTKKALNLLELTICFEISFEDAAERKRAKYKELQQQAQEKGYRTKLITVEVGSRGIVNDMGFAILKKEMGIPERALSVMMRDISLEAILQSHQIWCQRNQPPTP